MANNEHPAFKLFGKTIKADSDKRPPSSSSSSSSEPAVAAEERPAADEQQHAAAAAARAASGRPLPCPRCKSKETKFCYFNNYNVNQPRHFCKSCHRYWTAGGTLRNVPVGAGRRKNHRGAPPPPAAEDQVEVSTWIKS